MNVYAIDFETKFDRAYSLKKMPVDEYCQHAEFHPYLVSVYGPGGEHVGDLGTTPWSDLSQASAWVSHNASFDHRVFLAAQEKGLIPAHIKPPTWHCTADMCAYFQLPRSLQGAAEILLGLRISKQVREDMCGKLPTDLTPEQLKALHEYALADAKLCHRIWTENQARWPAIEKELSLHSRVAGIRGVHVDEKLIQEGIQKMEQVKEAARLQLPWDTSKVVASIPKLREACKASGIPIPASTAEDDEACIQWEETYGQQVPWVAALRRWRKANRTLRILQSMQRRTRNGIMPFALKYFGAGATGRWSGKEGEKGQKAGINMQNFTNAGLDGVDIRNCLIAAPGHTFIKCDLSQIEPRVLAWLVGDTELLERIASGMDVYEAHARQTMGYTDPRPLAEVDKNMRALAKVRVLELGYGCGARKFVHSAVKYGVHVMESEAARIVADFRRHSPKIITFWNRLYSDFLRSCRGNPDDRYEMELPSGRTLTYFNCTRARGGQAAIVMGQHPRFWYGAKICQNATQATARDVLASAYHRVLQAGYNVIWTVHDELVVQVEDSRPDIIQDEANNIRDLMSITPDWLPGCPVAAEATVTKFYKK